MKNILIVFLFLLSMSFYGQENLFGGKYVQDTLYIQDLADKVMLKLYIQNQTDAFYIFEKNNTNALELYPNVPSQISLSFDYQVVSFALSVPSKWTPFAVDEDLRGKTTNFSLAAGFFLEKWYQNFNYSNTKGYYVLNTGDFDPHWKEGVDPYALLPNMRVQKIEGETSYIMNANKYSHRAFLHQTQIQKKSVGSFIPSLSYSYLNRSDMNSQTNNAFTENVFSMYTLLGYQYSWVTSPNFSVSGGGNLGLGFRSSHQNYTREGVPGSDAFTGFSNRLQFNFNLCYQSPKIFYGLKAVVTGTTARQDHLSTVNINNSVGYGVLYMGFRFDAPRLLSQNYSKMMEEINTLLQ